jgi:hypothetical protein
LAIVEDGILKVIDLDGKHIENGRVPHPCAFFAQEPALSESKGWDSTTAYSTGLHRPNAD